MIIESVIQKGELVIDQSEIENLGLPDGKVYISIYKGNPPKTTPQIRSFYGPVIQQIQEIEMNINGKYYTKTAIKEKLKERFLKRKAYWSDGSPVLVDVEHPEREGVKFSWHVDEIPSLSNLSKDEFMQFLGDIQESYWHETGHKINIGFSPE